METKKTTFWGNNIDIINFCNKCFFYSSFYGFVAVTERNTYKNAAGVYVSDVTIYAGNNHLGGGSLTIDRVISGVKKYIRADEQKNRVNIVNFEIVEKNCNRDVKFIFDFEILK